MVAAPLGSSHDDNTVFVDTLQTQTLILKCSKEGNLSISSLNQSL